MKRNELRVLEREEGEALLSCAFTGDQRNQQTFLVGHEWTVKWMKVDVPRITITGGACETMVAPRSLMVKQFYLEENFYMWR